ncbi:hypothetical protein CR513_42598, partial [Mucuna pruriens]
MDKQISLAFTIEKYSYAILCDVVPIKATDILLSLRQAMKEFGSDIHVKEAFEGKYDVNLEKHEEYGENTKHMKTKAFQLCKRKDPSATRILSRL